MKIKLLDENKYLTATERRAISEIIKAGAINGHTKMKYYEIIKGCPSTKEYTIEIFTKNDPVKSRKYNIKIEESTK